MNYSSSRFMPLPERAPFFSPWQVRAPKIFSLQNRSFGDNEYSEKEIKDHGKVTRIHGNEND